MLPMKRGRAAPKFFCVNVTARMPTLPEASNALSKSHGERYALTLCFMNCASALRRTIFTLQFAPPMQLECRSSHSRQQSLLHEQESEAT